MSSPFPGMDPYLEGYLWPDVHAAIASKIRQQLVPKLRPRYAVRLEIYVIEDSSPDGDIGILYPDVQVMSQLMPTQPLPIQPLPSTELAPGIAVLPAPLTLPIVHPIPVRLARVDVRDLAQNQLVTCIEILSPVNKREPGLTDYRRKRQRLYQNGIHLLELDLLRRGTRPVAHPRLPACAYAIALTRARASVTELWPLQLWDALPTVPIPLRDPDEPVALDLQTVITEAYDEAGYDLSIDYAIAPPPPELNQAELDWWTAR